MLRLLTLIRFLLIFDFSDANINIMSKDNVDLIIEQWTDEIPELNTKAMAILGRLKRVAKFTERRLADNFSKFKLNSGEFDVLATLRRSGGEFKLKPTELYNLLMVTSGAMTNRVDTLEKKGLVIRVNDTEDRRTVYVKLTEEGLKVINTAVYEHVTVEEDLLNMLTEEERETFDSLLRKINLNLEKNK
ncbi:DNA-binding MarR family transcriptional regulator [Clostridium saccharoperbutylacetonicum]|uniref:Transcriptional regulator, MarR family n=2 Tax=Clostridium saccharoperbutylacetonicum TaxID=36745 RepID=M1MWY0_9CLOT|nr:MarR family transcriptional regulator [Clostridium saccharoperbutylacetonicum]AGF55977.1 transcriptional regulator, MarR family [Clostridium saccharoperbutylacetonicum N1-4(HMT)]NRT63284.1 DNA-binding MarR family transcriptional regulator [Clostridium saccharoperbutylacetonicum]NSB26646.1 DNA-binding MarR family transcriptional regulator [Clostridium saccharoperbutylacetonicum]NSB45996.1 DNA-binding MarR family transcriptional regulator [Clostridium saccharoperbutylacetonicum]